MLKATDRLWYEPLNRDQEPREEHFLIYLNGCEYIGLACSLLSLAPNKKGLQIIRVTLLDYAYRLM